MYIAGGTIVVDCMTAFTPREHQPYIEQPGLGMQEVIRDTIAWFRNGV